MQAIPSPLNVLDDALAKASPARGIVRALGRVARSATRSAVERHGVRLRAALRSVFLQHESPQQAHDSLRDAQAQTREILDDSRRSGSEPAVAAARCVLETLGVAFALSQGQSGNRPLAQRALDAAVTAMETQRTWPRSAADHVACILAAFLPASIAGWPEYDSVAEGGLDALRPALGEVTRALAGVNDGDEAWEVLAARGLIPVEWYGESARSFRGGRRDRFGRVQRISLAEPPDVLSAIALGSSPQGVLAAEQLTREFALALRAWGMQQPTHFEWAVLDGRAMLDQYKGSWPAALETALRKTRLSNVERAWAEGRAACASAVEWTDSYVPTGLREAISLTELWRVLVELDTRFPDAEPVPEAWHNERIASIPCAFAPLISLSSHGFTLLGVHGARAQLAMPLPTREQLAPFM
ncbi:MAG: hypothetical protein Q8Q09_20320 [Deltaproteobacteria bacterium]|nr:hypothetical protein [Deltaproteobacteria bacterium]